MNEYKRLRTEFNRDSFKKILREKLGTRCVNCDSDLDIDYHHIVPLALGGTNRISNIAPLCYFCHQKNTWISKYKNNISVTEYWQT